MYWLFLAVSGCILSYVSVKFAENFLVKFTDLSKNIVAKLFAVGRAKKLTKRAEKQLVRIAYSSPFANLDLSLLTVERSPRKAVEIILLSV